MNIDKKALKGIVDEIEASRARQRGETEHQREVMKRAKAHQLDAKAIRIVLQRRAMGESKREEQDYYVHSYELALGGKKAALEALEQGASVREAAKAGGISTGSAGNLAKAVQKSSFVDAETNDGEDVHGGGGQLAGGHGDLPDQERVCVVSARIGAPAGADTDGGAASGNDASSLRTEAASQEPCRAPGNGEQPPPTDSLGAVALPSSAERVASTINPDEDDLTIPEFLRGTPVAGNAF